MDLGVGAPGVFSSAFRCLSRVLGCSPLSSGGKGALPGRIHAVALGSEAQLAFGLFCSDFLNKVRVWRACRGSGVFKPCLSLAVRTDSPPPGSAGVTNIPQAPLCADTSAPC